MAQEEIIRVLKVDTKNSGKSINDLRKDIKLLRQELEKTTVGTEEFESTLQQLTQAQKSYNEVQQQVRDMSRTNQQEMVKFATFTKNLAKSYSALNAAIGLFSSGNEDVQRAMLKVQRTIQLIQGLDGVAGLVRDIPKIAASFKNWFNALDPVEKQVDRIAKGINGISPQKLQAINEANRAAAGTTTTTTTASAAGGTPVQQINTQTQAIQQQSKVITALNAARDEAASKAEALTKRQALLSQQIEQQKIKADALTQSFNQQGVSMSGLTARLADQTAWREKAVAAQAAGDKSAGILLAHLDAEIAKTQTLIQVTEGLIAERDKARLAEANAGKALSSNEIELKKVNKQLATYNALLDGSATRLAKAGKFLKSLLSTVGWTILISVLVTLVYKLWDYIKNIQTAAEEQRKLNKEINELTNKTGAKAIVVLKELAIAYGKLGDTAEEKEKFLKDYADKIKETGLAVDTVTEAEDVFVKNTQKYVNAILTRAKAQATENVAIKLYEDYLNKRYDLEQKLEAAGRTLTAGQTADVAGVIGQGYITEEAIKEQQRLREQFFEENKEAVQSEINALDKSIEERLKKMFTDIAQLESSYAGIFAELEANTTTTQDPDTTDWNAEYKKSLEALIKYTKERLGILEDARTKELESAKEAYDAGLKLIEENYQNGLKAAQGNAEKIAAVEQAKNDALKTLEITYEREVADIIKKYRDQALEDAKAEGRKQIETIQQQIEQIRRMNDTSNLRAPRQQNVETQYNQSAITTLLGLGAGWTNTYQSAEDVKAQYDAQVKYNNDLYMLIYERITKENELLNQQLQNEQLTADERFNIERTLVENKIALDDALNENYEANNEAFISMQQKRQQALNATLSVSSNLFGAMATMAKTESQNQEKREEALKAYKAFAVTQAIINTFQGANEAYTAMASIPYVGPALGIAASVAAIAMGIANVHSILSESMSSSSAASAASTAAPQAMQTPPIEYTRQLIGDSELDEVNQPIRCWVLESDITSTQNKVKVTEDNASF